MDRETRLYGTGDERAVAYLKDKDCVESVSDEEDKIQVFFHRDEVENHEIQGVVGYASVLVDGEVTTLNEPDFDTDEDDDSSFRYTTERDGNEFAEIAYDPDDQETDLSSRRD